MEAIPNYDGTANDFFHLSHHSVKFALGGIGEKKNLGYIIVKAIAITANILTPCPKIYSCSHLKQHR